MAINYRQPIFEAIKTKLSTLTHTDNTALLFGSVGTYYVVQSDVYPVCQVTPNNMTNEIAGYPEDNRSYGFSLYIYEPIGSTATNTLATDALERLMDIEDIVIREFTVIPSPFEHEIDGIDIYRTDVNSTNWNLYDTGSGITIALQIDITMMVRVNTLLL